MAGNDRNVGDVPDRVADVDTKPAESTLLRDVMRDTPSKQLEFARGTMTAQEKAELTAPLKSKDGQDAKIVNPDGSEYKGDYKPAETVKGEIKVETTLGNDTQWKVDLPEVKKAETKQQTPVEKTTDAAPADHRSHQESSEKAADPALSDQDADKKPGEKAGEMAIDADKAHDAQGKEKNLEAAENHQAGSEAGAEVGKELGEESRGTKSGDHAAAQAEKERQQTALEQSIGSKPRR